MNLMEQRCKKVPDRPSIDGYAIAKGWFTTLGLWLGGSLILAIWIEATRFVELDVGYVPSFHDWPFFALASAILAMIPGIPVALLLDRMLRRKESPVIQVAAFLVFFTLLPAIRLGYSMGDQWIQAFGFSSLLGVCAAMGRAAAFRQGRAFRRPTTRAQPA